MKVLAILLVSCLVLSTSAKSISLEAQLDTVDTVKLFGFVRDVWNHLIAEPINVLVSSLADMAAQLVVVIAACGIKGCSEVQKGLISNLWDRIVSTALDLFQNLKDRLYDFLDQAVSINISQGKRDVSEEEIKGIIGNLWDRVVTTVVDTVYDIVDQLVTDVFTEITRILINISQGKRDVSDEEIKGIIGNLWDRVVTTVVDTVYDIVDQLVQDVFTEITRILITVSQGKRDLSEEEIKGIIGNLWDRVVTTVVDTVTEIAQEILTGIITSIVGGKRDVSEEEMKGIFSNLWGRLTSAASNFLQNLLQNLKDRLYNFLDQLVSDVFTAITRILINISQGKRDLSEEDIKGIIGNLWDRVVTTVVDTVTEIAQEIITGIITSIVGGKRDLTEIEVKGFIRDVWDRTVDIIDNIVRVHISEHGILPTFPKPAF